MKSLSLPIVLLLFLTSHLAMGQDTLKTAPRGWTTELNVNLFQGQVSLNNAINQIKVRYFLNSQSALRLAFSFSNSNKEESSKNPYSTNPYDNTDQKKSNTFGINLGFEHHFTGTRRLSPYIGAEIAFGVKNSNETLKTKDGDTEVKGAWMIAQTYQYYNNGNPYNYIVNVPTEKGYTSFGINLLTGFDYYVAKHLYVGYELLLGYSNLKYDDVEITVTPKAGQTSTDNTTYPKLGEKESGFGAKIINGIRLGYTF